jgi:aminoglycoside 6'-N-acetyltransferase
MSKGVVELGPFSQGLHGSLLAAWVSRPHVARWWGDPQVAIREAAAPHQPQALILLDGQPVGYVRWQPAPAEELRAAGLAGLPEGIMDIDICLGELEALGQGIGPKALELLLARLWQDPNVGTVMMATSVDNKRAARAYEKVGFRRHLQFEDPGFGPSWLMLIERPKP